LSEGGEDHNGRFLVGQARAENSPFTAGGKECTDRAIDSSRVTTLSSGFHAILNEDAVVKSLLDVVLRQILASTLDRAKSTEEISRECGIPMSTCYVRVSELVRGGVLRREREELTRNGKGYALYRATIRTILLEFGAEGLDVLAVSNGDHARQLHASPMPLVAVGRQYPLR